MALEKHYTVAEVAASLQVSVDTVRRIFSNEPGVLKLARPNGFKRKYATLRIPDLVLQAYLTRNEVHVMPKRRRAA